MTSPVDTSVKYFHSEMGDAPVLDGTPGSLIAVLDACLVNGFSLKSVVSLTIASNVATATVSAGHSAEVDSVILVTGATPTALNGEQKVTSVGANSLTFATSGVSDQTATGTISFKLAPAKWAKTYSATNLAAYKSLDVSATACLVRVDDTSGQFAKVIGYESMSDVNTGSGLFPSTAQHSGGSFWSKSNAASSVARKWLLVADSSAFYFMPCFHASYVNSYDSYFFGDILSVKSGDAYRCAISGALADISTSVPGNQNHLNFSDPSTYSELFCARSYSGLGTAAQMRKFSPSPFSVSTSRYSSQGSMPYPNPADGGFYFTPVNLIEHSSLVFRGVFPGWLSNPQTIADGMFYTKDKVNAVPLSSSRNLITVGCGYTPTVSLCFIDVTGPWR
ncbi:hypothetical protein [Undibacterium sp. Xuan67W]|uniref:hypothetical protein n=1 Tax=Undibacterium sp. Xuan67W TaxID=3413057 RepID=UPI003BF1C8FA